MSDIVERLNRAGDMATPGEPCGIYYDAANEIKRLRLTDEEREAIERLEDRCAKTHCVDTARILRGLLERHGY